MGKKLRQGYLSLALAAPACCVAASMLVQTPGGEVPVGSLVVGDRVWSIDVETGRRIEATVLQVRRATRECMGLHWRDGGLICTPDHPLYAPETADYRTASTWTPGRGLLLSTGEGVQRVAVTEVERFAGVHEVIDLTLDIEPHNFVAAGVVVHNKSPVADYLEAEEDGPALELGASEEFNYRVRACLDGADGDLFVAVHAQAATLVPPTDNVPFSLAVVFDGQGDKATTTGSVPFDRDLAPEVSKDTACSEGVAIGFRRADSGKGGSISVSWSVSAVIDRVRNVLPDGAAISITIEPEP